MFYISTFSPGARAKEHVKTFSYGFKFFFHLLISIPSFWSMSFKLYFSILLLSHSLRLLAHSQLWHKHSHFCPFTLFISHARSFVLWLRIYIVDDKKDLTSSLRRKLNQEKLKYFLSRCLLKSQQIVLVEDAMIAHERKEVQNFTSMAYIKEIDQWM